jgi:hypothetical protein
MARLRAEVKNVTSIKETTKVIKTTIKTTVDVLDSKYHVPN